MDEETGPIEANSEDVAPAPGGESDVVESTSTGSRRRVLTFSIAGAVAAVAVIALSAVVIAQAGSTPVASPSPSPSESPTATASASPSPSPAELVAAPDLGVGFPDAYELTEEILAQAGPGWAVESYASLHDPYSDQKDLLNPAAIYLVDSDGVYYLAHVVEPGLEAYNSVVVAWRESTGEVVIDNPYGGRAMVLNLATREQTPLRRADLGVTTDGNEAPDLIMSSADGAELWSAYLSTGSRFFRWTEQDGFKPAALDEFARNNASFGQLSSWWNYVATIRGDGRVGLFESRDDPDSWESNEPDSLYAYDLSTDKVRVSRFATPASMSEYFECSFEDWTGADTVLYDCYLSATNKKVPVVLAGLPAMGDIAYFPAPTAGEGIAGLMSRIEFDGPTDPMVLHPDCGC